jgi:predicted DNA-binding ribbon-helix-helix protein
MIMQSSIVKRSVVIGGRKTSVSLEDPFWNGLREIAKLEKTSLSALVADINIRPLRGNLSSAIRLFVLDRLRAPTAEASTDRNGAGVAAPLATQDRRQQTSGQIAEHQPHSA